MRTSIIDSAPLTAVQWNTCAGRCRPYPRPTPFVPAVVLADTSSRRRASWQTSDVSDSARGTERHAIRGNQRHTPDPAELLDRYPIPPSDLYKRSKPLDVPPSAGVVSHDRGPSNVQYSLASHLGRYSHRVITFVRSNIQLLVFYTYCCCISTRRYLYASCPLSCRTFHWPLSRSHINTFTSSGTSTRRHTPIYTWLRKIPMVLLDYILNTRQSR